MLTTRRSLALRRERLTALSATELDAVAGGVSSREVCVELTGLPCQALSLDCLTGYYPSINAPCTTL